MSLPIVGIVHGNQECRSIATIMWDNAFAETGRVPFFVQQQVPWNNLKAVISDRFLQLTKRALNEDDLSYICMIISYY